VLGSEIIGEIIEFRSERNWERFHNLNRLAAKLSIEAAEVLELFEWGQEPDKNKLEEELADCLIILTYLFHDSEIDPTTAVKNKLRKNAEKYPLGTHRKPGWTETIQRRDVHGIHNQ